jgi:AcrR family transcriptional regulator
MLPVPKTNCQASLLDAAEAIVSEAGAAHLTLDAVAARAGVSKGGLIYHFPSKEALLGALAGRCACKAKAAREAALAGLPEGPARELRAEILSQLKLHEENARANGGMLAVMANQPELLQPVREDLRERFQALIASHPEPDEAAILLLATYGICMLEMLQLSPVEGAQRREIVRAILRHLEEQHGERS